MTTCCSCPVPFDDIRAETAMRAERLSASTIFIRDETMKPMLFATAAAMILVTSANSQAGNGYFKELGRNLGYGISDGYHAQRYCLPACTACSSGVLQPQPMFQHPMMQQPTMHQPGLAPASAPWAPSQFQQAGYAVGYPVRPIYQPWYQPSVPSYGQPGMPSLASPQRSQALHW